jgi:hypothetical protein
MDDRKKTGDDVYGLMKGDTALDKEFARLIQGKADDEDDQ